VTWSVYVSALLPEGQTNTLAKTTDRSTKLNSSEIRNVLIRSNSQQRFTYHMTVKSRLLNGQLLESLWSERKSPVLPEEVCQL